MKLTFRAFLVTVAIVSIGVFAGCSDDEEPSKAGTFTTATQNFGNGTSKAWVRLNSDGNPEAIGITLTDAALQNLPQDTSMATMPERSRLFTLPTEASGSGLVHATMDWNPKGHPPVVLYGKPHFDFHFYLISDSARQTIAPGLDPIPVDPQYMPADYFTPVAEVVPTMGVHYSDTTDLNNAPGQFEHTFIYGFYSGNMIFLEPMVTKAFLETKQSFSASLKLPQAYKRTGIYYPTTYSITFDSTSNEHVIALEGFVKR